jgi:predicted membrane channel-forming protein YqfA (hemolysin III family)
MVHRKPQGGVMLKRFNRWFDGLPEPRRFYFFLFILMGWLPFMLVSSPAPIVHAIGSVWLVITAIIAFSRIR